MVAWTSALLARRLYRLLHTYICMQGCTRLLVTHQRQYLPACDRVLVLRAGCIIADGSYELLRSQEDLFRELGPEKEVPIELDDAAYDQAGGYHLFDSPCLYANQTPGAPSQMAALLKCWLPAEQVSG